jgi:hypothetical protein
MTALRALSTCEHKERGHEAQPDSPARSMRISTSGGRAG